MIEVLGVTELIATLLILSITNRNIMANITAQKELDKQNQTTPKLWRLTMVSSFPWENQNRVSVARYGSLFSNLQIRFPCLVPKQISCFFHILIDYCYNSDLNNCFWFSCQGALLYNEYIVYNVDQIRMRYLLQVNFHFKYWLAS